MPRKSRIQSGTGVYHVMMRGIKRHSASLKIQKTAIPFSSASAMHRSVFTRGRTSAPIAATTMRMPLCSELVETPLGEHVSCLEYEDERSRSMSDDQVMLCLFEEFGISDGLQLQRLDKEQCNAILSALLSRRAGVRQLQRLTGIGKNIISNISKTILNQPGH